MYEHAEARMRDDRPSTAGLPLILAAAVFAALVIFIWSGGKFGGTKTVESDADLPKVTSPVPPSGTVMPPPGTATPENTGRR
jgi:hypothetical protein